MRRSVVGILCLLAVSTVAFAGPLPNKPQVVLDLDEGSFRMAMGWKTITVVDKDGARRPLYEVDPKTGKEGKALPVRSSWTPPKDWMMPGFDDSRWQRARGSVAIPQQSRFGNIYAPGNPAEWQYVCLRGRFRVEDPSATDLLKLILHYYGGAVVYVNGKEIQRGHLPAGEIQWNTLAAPYPDETYVRPDGRLYSEADAKEREFIDRRAKRVRHIPPKGWLDAVGIPNTMLVKGVNVIAIGVRAAPVRDLAIKAKLVPGSWKKDGPQIWPHCGVAKAVLTASIEGLDQNVAPSEGIHISTVNPAESLTYHDYSHPFAKPAPVVLVGARNGTYSGTVLVSSNEAITSLEAKCTELTHADGRAKIGSGAIRIRYAEANAYRRTGWIRPPYFDRLLSEAPDEIEAREIKIRDRKLQGVPTAIVPVWVTVKIPANAVPGSYTGTLKISADYFDGMDVPVTLKVHDWPMPDRKDWRLGSNVYQSPDSVAMYYDVEPWSDRHFELMGKSFDVLADIGSRVIVVPLVIRAPHINNTESMVRWIKQADGSFKHDFSRMQRYLDLYEKVVGKPRVLAIYNGDFEGRQNEVTACKVTVEDAKTGELSEMPHPPYGTPENKTFWAPVFKELRDLLKKRGWYDRAMIGHVSYCWGPTKETAAMIKELWPDGRWMSSCHGYRSNWGLPVLCNEWVWASGRLYDPDSSNSRYNVYPRPWRKTRNGQLISDLKIPRGAFRDSHPLPAFRHGPEFMLQHNLHGYGRLGGDFWPVRPPRSRRPIHLCDTKYALGHAISIISMISPGPDGAIHNVRSENFREGAQIAETVAWVRDRVDAKEITGELAERAEALLVTRAAHLVRTKSWLAVESCGTDDRDEQLYAIAAEIAKAVK